MEGRAAYEEYPYPVVFLPPYENPPAWIPLQERVYNADYNNELTRFLPRSILLKKPPGAQLGFNIRGGKASQLGIFISKVIPDSDAHRAGLQEGDQVLTVNNVDFQDIEHSKAVEILKTAREIYMQVRYFPYTRENKSHHVVTGSETRLTCNHTSLWMRVKYLSAVRLLRPQWRNHILSLLRFSLTVFDEGVFA
ncbi:PDZ domain-containing protein 11 isoform X1 [Dendrobates tinctorius]|uniref:PDZ domain-containing protein 11 isoform X1 n=1 Tax=Dendrobates tinctorius TaxID=92724 RepID=UPI003CC95474